MTFEGVLKSKSQELLASWLFWVTQKVHGSIWQTQKSRPAPMHTRKKKCRHGQNKHRKTDGWRGGIFCCWKKKEEKGTCQTIWTTTVSYDPFLPVSFFGFFFFQKTIGPFSMSRNNFSGSEKLGRRVHDKTELEDESTHNSHGQHCRKFYYYFFFSNRNQIGKFVNRI